LPTSITISNHKQASLYCIEARQTSSSPSLPVHISTKPHKFILIPQVYLSCHMHSTRNSCSYYINFCLYSNYKYGAIHIKSAVWQCFDVGADDAQSHQHNHWGQHKMTRCVDNYLSVLGLKLPACCLIGGYFPMCY
jgi:hypothetical protein